MASQPINVIIVLDMPGLDSRGNSGVGDIVHTIQTIPAPLLVD